LNESGFGKCDYVDGLSVDEVNAAIYETTKLYSISWVMQQFGEDATEQLFKFCHKLLETAVIYDV
jgi:uncharacterized protein YbbK (DUF523 family)